MPMGLENHNILRLKKCIYKGGKSQTSLGRINKYMCRSYSGDMLRLIWSSEKEGKAGVSKEASFSLILSHMVGTKFLHGKVYVLPPVWHATKSLYHYKKKLRQGETNVCQNICTSYTRHFKHSINRCTAWNVCKQTQPLLCWGPRGFPSRRHYEFCSLSAYGKMRLSQVKESTQYQTRSKVFGHSPLSAPVSFLKSCNFTFFVNVCVSTSAQSWVSFKL